MNRMGRVTEFETTTKAPQSSDAEATGVQEIAAVLRRWRWFLLALVIIGIAAAAAVYVFMPAKYSAVSTVVLIAPGEQITDDPKRAPMDSSTVQSEVAIIESAAVARIVVDRLKLAENPDWNGATAGGSAAPADAKAVAAQRAETALRRIDEVTTARRMDTSYAIEILVTAPKAEDAANLANARVAAYLEWHARANADSTANAAGWINERLETLRAEVEQKEGLVEGYRASQGLLAAEGSTVAEQQLASTRNAATEAERIFSETSARLKQVEDIKEAGGSVETSAAAMDSQVVQNLRVQEADIQRRLATLKQSYYDSHPDVQKVEAEARDTRVALDQELGRILANLRNEVMVAQNRMTSANAALEDAQRRLGMNNAGIVRLRELERDAAASRKSYEDYLSMGQETSARVTLSPAVARQLSPAVIPRSPDRPPLALLLIFGAAVGLFAGLTIMFTRRLLDDRLHGASDVLRKVGRRALVSIPHVRSASFRSLPRGERNPAGYAVKKPFSAFTETYRVLRKAIFPGDAARRNVVVAVTSALPDEGKTTTAWSLARVAALSGQRVIIVDCDLRRRSLSGTLTAKPTVGLSEVIEDHSRIVEAVVLDPATGASILPAMVDDLVVNDLLGSPKMSVLLDTLRKSYDLVVLDCPPVLAVADAIAAAALADCTVLVARAGRTRAKAVRSAINQVEAAGGFVAGLALNCVQANVAGKYSFDDSLYFQAAKAKYYIE